MKVWYENVRYENISHDNHVLWRFIWKLIKICIYFISLNLIILKYLRNFGMKTLGTKTLPVVKCIIVLYFKVIPMCFNFNLRGFAYAKLNLSLNTNKEMIYYIGVFWLILWQCIDLYTTFQKAKTNRQFRRIA